MAGRNTMQITEPVTMLTDYAIAIASVAFALGIKRLLGPRNRVSGWFWCAAFIASAIAAVSGGTYHGFALYFPAGTLRMLWNIAIYCMGATAAFMTAGVHSSSIDRKSDTLKWLMYGIVITLFGVVVQQSRYPNIKNFNHNDAYHLIQIVGLYFLYRCGRTVRDRHANF